MLEWKFSQVCDEYYEVLLGMCYDVTHDMEVARHEALNCLMDAAKYMRPDHSYDSVATIAFASCTNFLLRKWRENHLDQLSPPTIVVDK